MVALWEPVQGQQQPREHKPAMDVLGPSFSQCCPCTGSYDAKQIIENWAQPTDSPKPALMFSVHRMPTAQRNPEIHKSAEKQVKKKS